ncbi:MAG: sulfatase-like hydrolase/transferase, partial [Verrucomicrobia bacterium]|nr:sulfatase-like hydrolase/transferase [Verrucomicrobiota bacterium]
MNTRCKSFCGIAFFAALSLMVTGPVWAQPTAEIPSASSRPVADKIPDANPLNVVLILSDDHRYDVMGFMGHPFVKTPHMDRLAKEGVHFRHALVTTSLCSPSRASILTGLVTHRHGVTSNAPPSPPDAHYFPQYLQTAGYQTAFVGKWHMGYDNDSPRRGFDHWVGFKGQGSYVPGPNILININGKHVPQKGYITDELTDYAVDWLQERSADQPFFLYLSHKAVHSNFTPARRHKGNYADSAVTHPPTMPDTAQRRASQPDWVTARRTSGQGIGSTPKDFAKMDATYRKYCEAVTGIDDSIGRVLRTLRRKGLLNSTLVIYMGDNGFSWGEHGLTNKRHAYEESMHIPMLMRCPQLFEAGTVVNALAANID